MRIASLLLFSAFAAACNGDPVTWGDPIFQGAPRSPNEYSRQIIPDPAGCPTSFRLASAGKIAYAAWWRVNPDSSSTLMLARAVGNRGWSAAVTVDSSDHSIRGCGRPPPAITSDSVSGYVHLAYFVEPLAGPGIFFAHSMDSGSTFHAAVPIVFGRNPSRVSVAARGDRVAVAYEDPNAEQPIIGVALSRTMGHLFEQRMQATSSNGRAEQPVIRLSRDSVHLWWNEYSPNPGVSATRPAYEAGKWR